jgi:ATP-dependent DNA helicase RecG
MTESNRIEYKRELTDSLEVEYLGSGMPRILKAYPRTAYTFSTHFIRTSFPISKDALALEKEVTGEISADETVNNGSEKTREKILNLLIGKQEITTEELSEKLGFSVKGVDWQIAKLKKENLIRRIGPAKGGHWEIIKSGSK